MADTRVERRLAAIMALDTAGYSRLMGADEEGTLARLKACRHSFVDPYVLEHRGRIVKTTGDGILAEFASAVDAVRCAADIQGSMNNRNKDVSDYDQLEFRIGVHVGDIIIDDDDIFGDGVNIAARLEGIADTGGICISDDAYRQIRGKTEIAYVDMGDQKLKNIDQPMRTWRATPVHGSKEAAIVVLGSRPPASDAGRDKPSIAVLPFTNMSVDPQQEYFADGMVEDIIIGLSRISWLMVIARNSSFTYKGRAVDIKRVRHELGVRYVLEGSVRRSQTTLRITGQLIDASNGAHLWADRFDGSIEQVFELQDEITSKVIGAISPHLESAEIARSKRKPTETLAAYDFYLRGISAIYQATQSANIEAMTSLQRAIDLDDRYATAYGMLAWCHAWRKTNGWMAVSPSETSIVGSIARRAALLGNGDAIALSTAGYALAFVVGDFDSGMSLIERAVQINPNLAMAWRFRGYVEIFMGLPDAGLEKLNQFTGLEPADPLSFIVGVGYSLGHLLAGRLDKAVTFAERAYRDNPDYAPAALQMPVTMALTGKEAAARTAADATRRLYQHSDDLDFARIWPLRRGQDLDLFEKGLRVAGLVQCPSVTDGAPNSENTLQKVHLNNSEGAR